MELAFHPERLNAKKTLNPVKNYLKKFKDSLSSNLTQYISKTQI